MFPVISLVDVTSSLTYTPVRVPSLPLLDILLFINLKLNVIAVLETPPSDETPPLASPPLPIPLNERKLFPDMILSSIILSATCHN